MLSHLVAWPSYDGGGPALIERERARNEKKPPRARAIAAKAPPAPVAAAVPAGLPGDLNAMLALAMQVGQIESSDEEEIPPEAR